MNREILNTARIQLEGMRKETEDQISVMLKEIEEMSPEFAATFEGLANSAIDGYILKIKERLLPDSQPYFMTAMLWLVDELSYKKRESLFMPAHYLVNFN